MFTVRSLYDFRRSDIFRGYFINNFHGCRINVYVREFPLLVYSTAHIWYNDSKHKYFYVEEWEVELVKVIGKAFNMSLNIVYLVDSKVTENLEDIPFIYVGNPIDSTLGNLYEHTRSYLSVRFAWYTPCAVNP